MRTDRLNCKESEFLKPCPYCGATPSIYQIYDCDCPPIYEVKCKECGIKGEAGDTIQEAVKNWNGLPDVTFLNTQIISACTTWRKDLDNYMSPGLKMNCIKQDLAEALVRELVKIIEVEECHPIERDEVYKTSIKIVLPKK